MTVALRVRDLAKRFGAVRAVDRISFDVHEGSITGLIGPNGAGKTTAFDLITGHQQPDSGTVRIGDERVDRLPPYRVANMGVGRTFQLVRLLPRLTARENLLVAHRQHPGESLSGAIAGGWKDVEDEALAEAEKWLEFVGMAHRADVPAGNLSYGQSKLIEIARVLTFGAPLVLLDEPMSGINPTLRQRLLELIRDVRKEGKTFFIIEHDIEMIMAECDEIIVMDRGRIIAQGSPEEVRSDEAVVQAYLGRGRRRSFTASYGGQTDGT